MAEPETYTTAEIVRGWLWTGGEVQCLSIYTDRRIGSKGDLTKGKKVGTLIEDDVPTLLRKTADLFEQEGSWEAIAEMLRDPREPQ